MGVCYNPVRAKRQSSAGGRKHERDTSFSTKSGDPILEHELCGVCTGMGARADFLASCSCALALLFLIMCMYRGGVWIQEWGA